jgi:PAS domain S-box-containing protein
VNARSRRQRVSYDTRIFLLALLVGAPALILLALLLFAGDFSPAFVFTMLAVAVVGWLVLANLLRNEVVYHLRTLSNLLEALRMGDYSMRGRREARNDALGEVVWEVNQLGDAMRDQRLEVREVSALLRKVMSEIDIALFTFDGQHVLRLVNPAGERLLGLPAAELIGEPAVALGLEDLLDAGERRVVKREFGPRAGRWERRVLRFREGGLPHYLLVITDLSKALREEERSAWQRLIRVIGHEINNSLAPIKSMAGTLEDTVGRDPLPPDWREDVGHGLGVIASRADALARLMSAYAMLARLPAPRRRPVDLARLADRVANLEPRVAVRTQGDPFSAELDPDQLEQLLINLVKNAADATGPEGAVTLRWSRAAEEVVIEVEDDGPGIANPDNLFVPFFTTKPGGTGVGLVLCRQIAEAHGGQLTLKNRADQSGCLARLTVPERA